MILKLYDPNTLEFIDVLSLYESVLWETTYNTPDGNFQINCDISCFNKLKTGLIVENSEDSEHLGVIKSVKTLKSNIKQSLEVKGVMLETDIFSHRIVQGIIQYYDMTQTEILENLIGLSLTNPADIDRIMPQIGELIMPDDDKIEGVEATDYSAKYPSLKDEVFTLAQSINLGVKVKFNADKTKLDIVFYVGNDKTFGTEEPVILAREFGTITDCNYSRDTSQNANSILVVGEDNITAEQERVREEGEPLSERSIDVSSEVPFPTYINEIDDEDAVETNEDGSTRSIRKGKYFRYIKFVDPQYITNCDMWEKHEIERIDTEIPYYENEVVVEEKEVTEATIKRNINWVSSKGKVKGKNVKSSPKPMNQEQLNKAIEKHKNLEEGEKVLLGYIDKTLADKLVAESAKEKEAAANGIPLSEVFSEPEQEVYPVVYREISKAAPKKGSTNSKKSAKPKNGGKNTKNASKAQDSKVSFAHFGIKKENGKIQVQCAYYESVKHTYTETTFEDRGVVDIIFTNKGESPSEATKVKDGSVEGGNVMFYENFEAERLPITVYQEALSKVCKRYLDSFVDSEVVEVEIYHLSNKKYSRDYEIGDIVTARDSEIGFATDLRVTSVNQTWDSKGRTIQITLGTSVPKLTERIRLISKGGV